jgi:hypothetical protein
MKIGNIVSDSPIGVDKFFNVVDSLNDCIKGIPTLIIGLDYVRHLEPDFMDRRLEDGNFWTFTKEESRKHHIIDLDSFKDYCFNSAIDDISYIFIDPIQFPKNKIKKILSKINSLDNIVTFIYEDKMAYIFSENLIFGVDLKLAKYIGIKEEKIKSKLKSISTVFLDQDRILIEYKDNMERLDNQVKYIPFLYLMSNNE